MTDWICWCGCFDKFKKTFLLNDEWYWPVMQYQHDAEKSNRNFPCQVSPLLPSCVFWQAHHAEADETKSGNYKHLIVSFQAQRRVSVPYQKSGVEYNFKVGLTQHRYKNRCDWVQVTVVSALQCYTTGLKVSTIRLRCDSLLRTWYRKSALIILHFSVPLVGIATVVFNQIYIETVCVLQSRQDSKSVSAYLQRQLV